MGKTKTMPWNIYEFLDTENRIRLYVEAAIDEAKTDTDPSFLADTLATAAEARRRLGAQENAAEPSQTISFNENTAIGEFDKTARQFGYRVTLTPVAVA